MANIKSAEKKARQALVRKARNNKNESTVHTAEKKVRAAVAAGDKAKAEEAFRAFAKTISKVASKGIIKKNTASRKIGRMSKFMLKPPAKAAASKATATKSAKATATKAPDTK